MYVWGALDYTNEVDRRCELESHPLIPYPTRMPNIPFDPHTIKSISCGQKHTVMVAGGHLYGFGANYSNQMGQAIFEKADKVSSLMSSFTRATDATPDQVSCGAKHTLVKCLDGTVWSIGDNTFGQLGRKDGGKPHWGQVLFDDPIEQVEAGYDQSYALSGGKLYSWGSQRHGSLAHGTTGELERIKAGKEEYNDVLSPKLVYWFVGQRIVVLGVSAGKEHLLVRSETDVYCVGLGFFGKLGQGNTNEHLLPKRVTFPERKYDEKLVAVAAGQDHSVAMKRSSEFGTVLYIWGRIDMDVDANPYPTLVTEAGNNLTKIVASKYYTMALNENGELQVWGKSPHNPTLGVAEGVKKRWPTKIGCLDGHFIRDMTCGPGVIVALGDDAKMVKDGELTPLDEVRFSTSVNKDVVVSMDYRNPTYPYDVAAQRFFERVFAPDEDAAIAHWKAIPEPPAKTDNSIKYKPTGAKALHRGSKVRVWMDDIYALGTVMRRDLEGDGYSKYHFEIDWAREDWDPEVIELHSEDEGLDEENEARWQHLWFVELPDGCQDNTSSRTDKFKLRSGGVSPQQDISELIDDE